MWPQRQDHILQDTQVGGTNGPYASGWPSEQHDSRSGGYPLGPFPHSAHELSTPEPRTGPAHEQMGADDGSTRGGSHMVSAASQWQRSPPVSLGRSQVDQVAFNHPTLRNTLAKGQIRSAATQSRKRKRATNDRELASLGDQDHQSRGGNSSEGLHPGQQAQSASQNATVPSSDLVAQQATKHLAFGLSTPSSAAGQLAAGSQRTDRGRKGGLNAVRPPQSVDRAGVTARASSRSHSFLTNEQIAALQAASGMEYGHDWHRSAPQQQSNIGGQISEQTVEGRIHTTEEQQTHLSAPTAETVGFTRRDMHMPPVIGTHSHYSNKRLKYTPIIDGIDEVRHTLFELTKPVLLNSQQIADYWPHMTNLWIRSAKRVTDGPVWREDWECRQRARVTGKRKIDGNGVRNRPSKRAQMSEAEPCCLRIRRTYCTVHADSEEDHKAGIFSCRCIPEWLYLERTQGCANTRHTHDLDEVDKFKRSDALMLFARIKVEEGYSFATIAN